jgi:hypothetical protein
MPKGCGARLFNFLAVVFLGLSGIGLGWVVEIAVNPYGWLNPFPPPTPVAEAAIPGETHLPGPSPLASATLPSPQTVTVVNDQPSPTWTVTPADTETPMPLLTITPSPSSTPWLQTATPRASPTRSVFTFTAGIGYQVHPVQLCDWMGVAGTVVDLEGRHVAGAFVHIWGLGGVDELVAVGANPRYGASGWELRLGRAQIVGNWNVQLVASPDKQMPLSDIYTISMPGDCDRNLALVRFQQNH